jgi:hypothetical protein
MKTVRVAALLLLAVLAAFPLPAQDQDAVLKLKNQVIDLQNKGTLGFREFTLCSNILGYGSFVPLEKPQVPPGAELQVYYEPVNVFTNRVKGQYEIWYTQDIVLTTDKGAVLYEQEELLNFRYSSRSPVFDLYATNSLSLGELGPGRYVYKVVLRDKLKGATAEYKLPFSIVK